MLFFALLFAGLAVFGACVGFGTVGQPIYGQALNSYGWALCINGAALTAYFVLTRSRRALRARRRAIGSANRTPPMSLLD
jgi:ABC-type proline/glycine betaine transport system permease subunit